MKSITCAVLSLLLIVSLVDGQHDCHHQDVTFTRSSCDRESSIEKSTLTDSNVAGRSRVTDTTLSNSDVRDSELVDCTLTGSQVEKGSYMSDVTLTGTRVSESTIVGCTITGSQVDGKRLRGCTVTNNDFSDCYR